MRNQKKLLFASSNQHKMDEVRLMLPPEYLLLGLHDIQWTQDIPEPYDSFEENALAKTSFIFQHTGMSCFADDSGLKVDALGGRPGVRSARYAGEHKGERDNLLKVLQELGDEPKRTARFIAVIAYQLSEKEVYLFKGQVTGSISYKPVGLGGFGYDPIFIPAGFDQTFGQLSPLVKNLISHRATAMNLFLDFIKTAHL